MKNYQDSLNTAVFTTRYVLEKGSAILFVNHYDEDGAWEFLGDEEDLNDEDFKVVSLDEIIKLDKSVLDVADLPLGKAACRDSINSPWRFYTI